MKINTDGLVLKQSVVGESDRLVTILTRDIGVVRAFAKGAAKPKNKNASATTSFCFSHFTLFKSKDTYYVDDAEPVEVFFDLRSDVTKVSLAQYFCEFVMFTAVEGENTDELLRLTLNSLYLIMKDVRPQKLVKAVFEFRAMSICGYMPDMIACARCGKTDGQMRFSVKEGVILCSDCSGDGVPLDPSVRLAIHHIVSAEFERIFSFDLTEEKLAQLAKIAEQYVLYHCQRRFTALEFYNGL